jgi:diacylglycerol kinase (ATP)
MPASLWLVAINPHSGNGRGSAVAARVTSYLNLKSAHFHAIAAESAPELSRQIASELDSGKYAGVIAVGGDGLAHLILQVCVPRNVPFAIIPAGTGNDFVRSLGWSLENIEPLLDRVLTSEPSPIDLGNVDSCLLYTSDAADE